VAPDQRRRITATADSTSALGGDLSARNLTDGDLTTAWIAGDRPTIHLRWPDKQPVGEVVLAAAGGLSTRPEKIEISSPDGAAVAGVDENGVARFDPITTDRLDITVTATAPLTVHNPVADADLQLPVGLTEAYLPALDRYRTPQPSPTRTFSLSCGKGPEVTVDGTRYATRAQGSVRDLVERRPITVTPCGRAPASLGLPAGTHTLETPRNKGPLRLTDATLTRTDAPSTAPPAVRGLRIRDWLGDRKEVTVGSGPATYLTTYENVNDGWKATLDGKELTPLRLDGWQQGFLVPQGAGGTVKLSYEPARTYEAGLFGGAAGVLALAGIALFRRRAASADVTPPAPPPGLLLGTVALTLVGAVIAGPLALLVPALALVAWRRHALLVPIAFLAMAGAGVAAAVGAGEPSRSSSGAFGPVAQLLALVALFAALATTRRPPDTAAGPSQEGEA
jgi:arabinofuranan 3-O-arabinosyltransferase